MAELLSRKGITPEMKFTCLDCEDRFTGQEVIEGKIRLHIVGRNPTTKEAIVFRCECCLFGKWTIEPHHYVAAVRRYANEIGNLDFAAPQDWMCEEAVLQKTGFSIAEHQRLTLENFLTLRELAPELPFIPVLQGCTLGQYLDHAEMYEKAGVNLQTERRFGGRDCLPSPEYDNRCSAYSAPAR